MKNDINDTRGMAPMIDNDPMHVNTRMVKPSKQIEQGLIENIIRIFPLPASAWDDMRIIDLRNGTNFPDYYSTPVHGNRRY
jgi:hypothetical protein